MIPRSRGVVIRMRLKVYSYRFAEEILQHEKHREVWDQIIGVCESAPLFIWPNKSKSNAGLDVVQQLMNAYFDRRLCIDSDWAHHPLATRIADSGLRSDFRKSFGDVAVQVEVQFGNMARWYSDIFKFQTAYSQELSQIAVSIVPMASLAKRIDSNIAYFERALRELPSAELSITLPILLIGIEPDDGTPVVDVSQSQFSVVSDIIAKGRSANLLRVINGWADGTAISVIGPDSPIGPTIEIPPEEATTDEV
jgi:hypothetical protein